MKIIEKHENHLIKAEEAYVIDTCPKCGSVLEILRRDCCLERCPNGRAYVNCPVCNEQLVIQHDEWKVRELKNDR